MQRRYTNPSLSLQTYLIIRPCGAACFCQNKLTSGRLDSKTTKSTVNRWLTGSEDVVWVKVRYGLEDVYHEAAAQGSTKVAITLVSEKCRDRPPVALIYGSTPVVRGAPETSPSLSPSRAVRSTWQAISSMNWRSQRSFTSSRFAGHSTTWCGVFTCSRWNLAINWQMSCFLYDLVQFISRLKM